MANNKLWDMFDKVRNSGNYEWIELSHPLSEDTPHWSGFPAMRRNTLFNYPDGFFVHEFTLVSQYGTHVDAPNHFVEGAGGLDGVAADELVAPLCVIDIREKAAANVDCEVEAADIEAWEAENGQIPPKAFVAICSGWSGREDKDNLDAAGNKHFPGWGLSALKFLVEKRDVLAVGHETSDTDAPISSSVNGYVCETYILAQGRYQIELLANLDRLPATGALIFCGFPRAVGSPGFTARCIALSPK